MVIVELFLEHPQMSLTDVSARTGFDPATATRYLRRLEERRWLERDPVTKQYILGTALIALGRRAIDTQPVRKRVLPHMYRLLALYNETTNLAAHRNGDLVIIDALESQRSIRRGASIGETDDPWTSALGKAALSCLSREVVAGLFAASPPSRRTARTITDLARMQAELDRVRRRGYAVDDEESEIGLKCVGVAITDADGYPTHAVSVSGPASRLDDKTVQRVGESLQEVRLDVSENQHPRPISPGKHERLGT